MKKIILLSFVFAMLLGVHTIYAETPELINVNDIVNAHGLTGVIVDSIDTGYTIGVVSEDAATVDLSSSGFIASEPMLPNSIELPDNVYADGYTESDISSISTFSFPSDYANRITNINAKDALTLKNQTGRTNFIGDNLGAEYIDPLTGNLVVTETDLALPGRDGLDLSLSRYYSLAQAELYEKTSSIRNVSQSFILEQEAYIVVETVTNSETNETAVYRYPYYEEEYAYKRVMETENRPSDGIYTYSAEIEYADEGDIITIDYYYTSELTSSSYQRIRSDLGAGWSWSFPSIQTIKDDYEDTDEMPKALYYHDGKGNVMEVKYDDLNGCWFENYVGKDITIDICEGGLYGVCDSSRIDYIVEDANETQYYFGPTGELRMIEDRYGNEINFDYTEKDFYGAEDMPVLNSITDSVGRLIMFDYRTEDGYEYIEIEVTSPLEDEKELNLSYKKRMINIHSNGDTISIEPVLISVTKTIDVNKTETTQYIPAEYGDVYAWFYPVSFTLTDKFFDSEYVLNTSGYASNLVYILGEIRRPHSISYYNYEKCERNLGHSGVSEAFRIIESGDRMYVVEDDTYISSEYKKNRTFYQYSEQDYTGYPNYLSIESIPEEGFVTSSAKSTSNVTLEYWYDKYDNVPLLKSEEVRYDNLYGNDLIISKETLEYSFKQPIETKITYQNEDGYQYDTYVVRNLSSYLDKTFGKPIYETGEIDSETFFADYSKYEIDYTYDHSSGQILSKSWYMSDDTLCAENYEYDSQGRISRITAPDGTTTEISYEYINGNVSKVTETTQNDTGTTVVVSNYTSATGYSLPSTVTKTVTNGENTTSNTVSYAYNMLLGTVESTTDSDGNTTHYEYDNLGRVTRIVYPKYSAYSSYNTKDLEILPVKNIIYNTVFLEDDRVNSDEKIVTQGVLSKITYYDVTDLSFTYPTNAELSECDITYYGEQGDYYLGTGELVRSAVADIVNGAPGTAVTTYYYDEDNTIVEKVDAKGERTKVQYDGLGRVVKITDEFDNYTITEYNIGSNENGFISQSYFVPASDRSAKENVSECKYDIHNRVISEKHYVQYPDLYSEVNYAYDYVGNVIGTKDANGNFNEDGYTRSNTYDEMNRLVSSKNALNEVLTNTYDNLGNIKKQTITDSKGNTSILFQRQYDGEGKIVSDTDNSNHSNTYTYNSKGQLVEMADKDNKTQTISYNEMGIADEQYYVKDEVSSNLIRSGITSPFGATKVFDIRLNYNADVDGYVSNAVHTISNVYSPTGKLIKADKRYAYPTGLSGIPFRTYSEYTYDENGNVRAVLHGVFDEADSTVFANSTTYQYNKNRISKVQINGSNTQTSSDSVNVKYEYYLDGKLKTIIFPPLSNGDILKTEYTYDGLSQPLTVTNYKGETVLSSYSYTYDKNGNVITVSETVNGETNTVNYTYDKLDRISTVSGTKGADSYYEYDARGNRKANFEEIDFLSEESAEFRYSETDKLYYAEVGENITQIEYSADGYRYVKQDNSSYPQYYIYDASGRLVSQVGYVNATISGETKTILYPRWYYVWGTDRVLAQINILTNQTYYYLYNGHGDVVQIVDNTGAVANTYDYDIWGNFLEKTEAIDNPFTYFGQTYDETTGLYYLRARYYDPSTGRFTQQDPAEDSYNWYVYGGNNPVRYIDIYGLSFRDSEDTIWSTKHDEFGIYILFHWLYGDGDDYIHEGGSWGEYR